MSTPPRHPELAAYIDEHVIQRGDFVLVSGARSHYYIDGKLASLSPRGARLIADAILSEVAALARAGCRVDAVGGMDMGATPIAGAVAYASEAAGRPLPTFVVRKEAKTHGTQKRIEGPMPPGARVVLVDDTVTSGGSILQAVDAAEEAGCEVVLALSVVDRNQGARERMTARGIRYQPLVRIEELHVDPAADDAERPGASV